MAPTYAVPRSFTLSCIDIFTFIVHRGIVYGIVYRLEKIQVFGIMSEFA